MSLLEFRENYRANKTNEKQMLRKCAILSPLIASFFYVINSYISTLNMVLRETFHALQQYLIEEVDFDAEISNSLYFQTLRDWKNNNDEYREVYIDVWEAYWNQPLEVAAREYAEQEAARIFAYVKENEG